MLLCSNWHKLAPLDPWVLGVLAKLRELIVEIEAQLAELQTELLARVKDEVAPKGLGGLTLVTLDGEVCDWHRFIINRFQIGRLFAAGLTPGGPKIEQNIFSAKIGQAERAAINRLDLEIRRGVPRFAFLNVREPRTRRHAPHR
jgi:hypothetical protein